MTELSPTTRPETEPSVDESSSFEEIGAAVQYYFDRFHEHTLAEKFETAMNDLAQAETVISLRYSERNAQSVKELVGTYRRRAQLYLAQGDTENAHLQLRQLGYPLSEYDCGDERAIVELLYELLPYDKMLDEKTRLQRVGDQILLLLP